MWKTLQQKKSTYFSFRSRFLSQRREMIHTKLESKITCVHVRWIISIIRGWPWSITLYKDAFPLYSITRRLCYGRRSKERAYPSMKATLRDRECQIAEVFAGKKYDVR